MEKVRERRNLRDRLLSDMYDYYFANEGSAKDIQVECEDMEVMLAYRYLSGQGLVALHLEPRDRNKHFRSAKAMITNPGIVCEEDRRRDVMTF